MASRIEIIANACKATKNNAPTVEFDGSDEWDIGHSAYERATGIILEKGVFNFSTQTAALARTGDAPEGYERWTNAYAMPAGCLKMRTVKMDDADVRYIIVDNQILCPETSVVGVYVREPAQNSWPNLFVEALTLYVEAGLLRGLNEDHDAADKREKRADLMFETAHTRSDQQTPGRAMFTSRVGNRRRGGTYLRRS
jgi:hypothetical protein